MDSVSQIVLGASVAGVCVPVGHRRKALLVGAALGTLPDLDVVIDYGDPVSNFTYHRGFSHSLFVLLPFSILLWLILRRLWEPVKDAPWPWLAAITLTLVTHPLLDAHTVYGTQLLWPLTTPPVMWSTLFIIDPLYTLPLLVGVLTAVMFPRKVLARTMLAAGLAISTAYVGWSWIAKSLIERDTVAVLSQMNLQNAPRFSIPTPFNTLLWRVVVMTDDGYLEGFNSLVANDDPMQLKAYPSDYASLEASSNIPAVARLRWFTHNYLKTEVRNDRLILRDLRMGVEPKYIFSHAVAIRGNPHWKPIPPERIGTRIDPDDLQMVWNRIWSGS
ncbi:MAG TPA: metal-dependent hydrolase [Burkholderiales bacterium]|nr:metal-dependent hydrolase [Burkholderiales bacterium]